MLIQLLIEQPLAAVTIVQRTPVWVWWMLAGLLLLGLSQLRDRQLGWRRAALPTLGLAAFGLFSLASDLRTTPWLASGLAVWALALASLLVLGAARNRHGLHYEPQQQRFHLPGSAVPLLTIVAIFLLKYGVGVELAMQPALRQDPVWAHSVAALYGALTGLLGARPLQLWRIARHHAAA